MKLEFTIKGPDADAFAKELQGQLEEELGEQPQVSRKSAASRTKDLGLGLAVLGLVVALPGAINEIPGAAQKVKKVLEVTVR
jgi:hypothetical protein